MAHLTLSQPAPELSLTPLSGNGNQNCGCNIEGLGKGALEKLGLDLENLVLVADEEYSDVTMIVDGKRVPIHRCIIAMRCPSFRKVFAGMGAEKPEGSNKPELELNSLVKEGRIGYEAFMTVMGYVYGGKLKPLNIVVECWDPSCGHLTCRPAIDFVLELLCASLLFGIEELKTMAEQYLINHLDDFQVDNIVHILNSACTNGSAELQSLSLSTIASSNIDDVMLEKEVGGAMVGQVRQIRIELGIGSNAPYLDAAQESQCKQIHRALDLDDIELVQMLLDEKKLDLDGAYALHYAAAYCNARTLARLLDLGSGDVNLRNGRGLTVLHVAAWRMEPQALGNLLAKGARLKEYTLDNRRALDICRRLVKKSQRKGDEYQKDSLCIEILEEAEKNVATRTPSSAVAMMALPSTEENLMSTLLYLENRVSLARLLFPQVLDVVMDMSQVDVYSEFTRIHYGSPRPGIASKRRKHCVDLNEEPTKRLAGLIGCSISDESKESRVEVLKQRCDALGKATATARRFFPRYSEIIDKYVLDDDWNELSQKASEEQLLKKRRYVELKGILQDAFMKDKADMDNKASNATEKQKKSRSRSDVPLSSSSSTSSSRGTGGSLVTKL